MCESDLDSILSYLSSKVNRIFCDREFVGCVKEDFDVILQDDDKCCVLFPKLKPIFLKVLRYQAAIFDLCVFCIGNGPNQVAVVCKKDSLKSNEPPIEEQACKIMNEPKPIQKSPTKKTSKTRPTQSYYIPPAQRGLTQKDETMEKKSAKSKSNKISEKLPLHDAVTDLVSAIESNSSGDDSIIKTETKLNKILDENESVECAPTSKSLTLENCGKVSVNGKRNCDLSECTDEIGNGQKLLEVNPSQDLPSTNNATILKLDIPTLSTESELKSAEIDLKNFEELCNTNLNSHDLHAIIESSLEKLFNSETEASKNETISLDNSREKVISVLKSIVIEQNDLCSLDKNAIEQELILRLQEPATELLTKPEDENESRDGSQVLNTLDIKSLYICCNETTIKKKTADCDIDNENEEIQRAIENMNRRTRPIIKHVWSDNTLRINETKKNTSFEKKKLRIKNEEEDNLCSWEDMFDEKGDLQPEYIEEIADRIGCDVKVVKASHDYSAYQNTKYEDLEHVIELYDFPSTFKTQDLVQIYKGAYQDPMYIKWCDETHALLVLSSPAQAQRALQIEHDLIKSRPLTQASSVAAITASSSDLKPAMKRPQTNMQTARRLINTHLGTKSTLSKEEAEQERQALRNAREQRRQERQNEKDAWEGRPHNTKL